MKSRINDVGKVLGGMKIKRRLCEEVASLYGAELWSMAVEERRLNVMEMTSVWSNLYRLKVHPHSRTLTIYCIAVINIESKKTDPVTHSVARSVFLHSTSMTSF